MSIGIVNYNGLKVSGVSFKGDAEPVATTVAPRVTETDKFVKTEQPQITEKTKSGLTKRIGTGIISAVWPGLGQFANGQWFKAACLAVGIPMIATAGFIVGGALGIIPAGLLYLWNIHDAYKNA